MPTATKAYEEHCARNGKPDSHAKAKEIFAGFAAAAITQIVETKGIDAWDAYKQKEVEKKAHQRFEEVVIAQEY
ncbi:hypothetical protein J3R83DRAFT_9672 [Lanmaoa asiatica]|nr:hypothetical protein J3R83DRAFT_9672 [Lanmaoa asiatica]